MIDQFAIDAYIVIDAQTSNPATGAETDADAAPGYAIYADGADLTAPPVASGTMTKRDDAGTTGYYQARVQLTVVAGFAAGVTYKVRGTATVGGTAGADILKEFQIVASPLSMVAIAALPTGAPRFLSAGGDLGQFKLDDFGPPVDRSTVWFYAQCLDEDGAPVDADADPAFRVYRRYNEDAVVAVGTLAKRDDTNTTGWYVGSIAVTLAPYADGRYYTIRGTATIGGVVCPVSLGQFEVLASPLNVGNIAGEVWAGSGTIRVTITVENDDGDAVPGCPFSVTGDADLPVYQWLTDPSGEWTMGLYTGKDYNVTLGPLAGYGFANPYAVTVGIGPTQAQTLTITGIGAPSAPADPTLCRVYAYMKYLDGASAGAAVGVGLGHLEVLQLLTRPATSTVIFGNSGAAGDTDATGYVYVDIARGAEVQIMASVPGVTATGAATTRPSRETITVPDAVSYDVGPVLLP